MAQIAGDCVGHGPRVREIRLTRPEIKKERTSSIAGEPVPVGDRVTTDIAREGEGWYGSHRRG